MITKQQAREKRNRAIVDSGSVPKGVELAVNTLIKINDLCKTQTEIVVVVKKIYIKDFINVLTQYDFDPRIVESSRFMEIEQLPYGHPNREQQINQYVEKDDVDRFLSQTRSEYLTVYIGW